MPFGSHRLAANAPRPLYMRFGLLALVFWVVLEVMLAKLIANRFGWGTTILLHTIKGGLGLLLIGLLLASGLKRLRESLRAGEIVQGGSSVLFPLASAILITLPGLVPAMIGLMLFSPSIRTLIRQKIAGKAAQQGPGEIDLSADEWHETKKPTRIRRAIQRKASLEREPPSV